MVEYLTEAIVLSKEASGDYDSRVTLYTKNLGKIIAKATSARKIVSKLNPHLEPLNLIKVRLIYKNNYQITDALIIRKWGFGQEPLLTAQALVLLDFVKKMTEESDADYRFWSVFKQTLFSGQLSYNLLLRELGFNAQFAVCSSCQGRAEKFRPDDFSFWCNNCARL